MDPDQVAKLLAGAGTPTLPGAPPSSMLSTPPPTLPGAPPSGMLNTPPPMPPAGPTQDYGMHLGHGPQFPYAMGVGPDMNALDMQRAQLDRGMMRIQDPELRAKLQEKQLREELSPNMKSFDSPYYPGTAVPRRSGGFDI